MDNLKSERVTLRPPRYEDFEYFASLRNNLRTQGWNQRLSPCFTAKRIKERFEERIGKGKVGFFAIEVDDEKLIGYVDYQECPPRLDSTMGISIGVEYWGKGYAEEAVELVLRFLFEERGLHVVSLWTQAGNERAIRLAKKMGFKISARLRESAIIGGRVFDTLMMDMLREEYYESRNLEEKIMDHGR